MGFYTFCGSAIWDESQTWNTTDPDFSPCFHKTGLVWISCGILWLFTPLEIIFIYKQHPQKIPWTGLNVFKLLLNLLLTVNSVCVVSHMFLDSGTQTQFYLADYWAYGIKAVTYCLAAILVICDKKNGVHSSGVLCIFWLVATVCGGITYRSYLNGLMAKDVSTDEFIFIANMVAFPLLVAQLVLAFFVDTVITGGKAKNACPLKSASFPSVALFGWFDALVWKGYRTELTEKDMWDLDDEYKATEVQRSFDLIWKQLKKKYADITKKNPSFLGMLWRQHRFEIFMGFFLKVFADLLTFTSPLMLRQLINFVSDPNEPVWKGYLYTAAMFLASITTTICMHNYFFRLQSIGIGARAAVISTIYRKALRMSTAAKRTSTTGEVVNIMSVDAQRVMDVWPYVGFLITTPLTVALALYMLWTLLGPSVLAGIAVIVIVVPLNLCLARVISRLQTQLMELKDERIKLINEILGGMKILKLYAWELSFNEQISSIRASELKILKKILYLEAVTNFLFMFTPFLIALTTFATFVLSDENNILDPAKAFVSIALFDLIRFPLALVPLIVSYLIQASVSFKRLDKFMASEELDLMQIRENISDDGTIINMESATFSWALDESPVLQNINLRVAPQNLFAVVGTVGAGKSSLISAILGEMEKISGKITRKGTVAYVSQQAWIQNATVRENILFGSPMNGKLYSNILDLCALRQDLDVLPGGDNTEIGEKGINLSGGQKQRISLARAVYNNADIYLLDDPLSAVDAHVGKHIFDNVIGPNGVLAGKTRILVTHGISILPHVDCVVVLSNGTISEVGSYKDLVEKSGAFAEFLMTYLKEDRPIDEMDAAELLEIQQGLLSDSENKEINRRLSVRISRALSSDDELLAEGANVKRRRSSRLNSVKESPSRHPSIVKQQSVAALINKEQTESGSVGWNVYIYYFRSCRLVLCLCAIFAFALSCTSSVSANVWLSFWSSDKPNPDGSQNIPLRDLRLGVYASLGTGQVICSLFGALFLLRGTVRASSRLHGNMLSNVLHAPMSFFDTTPLGRILNRFSRDVDVLDATIPMFLRPFIDSSLQIVGVIAVICFSTPIFLAALVPISVIYYFIQRVFISTSRQLKRLESVSRSPIFSHFSETLSGLPTIRAYKVQDQFTTTSDKRLDVNNGLLYPFLVAKRWLAVRLEFVGSLVVFTAALLAVVGRDSLEAGTVGLSVSYALSVTLVLTMLVRNWTEVESNSVSIERIKEYTELSSEAAWERDEFKPLEKWPEDGAVKFENYSTRYRNGLPLVLKSITCDIRSGEKIGVVGRTGAGKSSFTLALFRLIEASDGIITIDGVNIGKIGLHDLRSKLTIIPQDPVLFFGSLRMNLDPFSKYTDEDIWRALEHSHLKEFVTTLSAGLQHPISEGGENLSVGQRQLVCLARALLRKTKLLILDEATAAVDLETDDLIQTTIRKEFADCTIITIAHRLNTIMDSDRVMVLENGDISEFDSPSALLENKSSIFYSMANDAGLV